jgi:hypothetical protein
MGVFGATRTARTFDFSVAMLATSPFAMVNYIKNRGDTPVRLLEVLEG